VTRWHAAVALTALLAATVPSLGCHGETVEAASALYRKTIRLAVGDQVRLSYRPGNPRKIAIGGYDFRMREPIGSAAGLVTAIVAILVAVTL